MPNNFYRYLTISPQSLLELIRTMFTWNKCLCFYDRYKNHAIPPCKGMFSCATMLARKIAKYQRAHREAKERGASVLAIRCAARPKDRRQAPLLDQMGQLVLKKTAQICLRGARRSKPGLDVANSQRALRPHRRGRGVNVHASRLSDRTNKWTRAPISVCDRYRYPSSG